MAMKAIFLRETHGISLRESRLVDSCAAGKLQCLNTTGSTVHKGVFPNGKIEGQPLIQFLFFPPSILEAFHFSRIVTRLTTSNSIGHEPLTHAS